MITASDMAMIPRTDHQPNDKDCACPGQLSPAARPAQPRGPATILTDANSSIGINETVY